MGGRVRPATCLTRRRHRRDHRAEEGVGWAAGSRRWQGRGRAQGGDDHRHSERPQLHRERAAAAAAASRVSSSATAIWSSRATPSRASTAGHEREQLVDSLRRLTDRPTAPPYLLRPSLDGQVPLGVQSSDDGLYIGGNNRTGKPPAGHGRERPARAERRALHAEGKDGSSFSSRETGGFAVLGKTTWGRRSGA